MELLSRNFKSSHKKLFLVTTTFPKYMFNEFAPSCRRKAYCIFRGNVKIQQLKGPLATELGIHTRTVICLSKLTVLL